ncbi:MAG: type I restriction endonuclease subunit R, partial [Anaerolineae bacterium]
KDNWAALRHALEQLREDIVEGRQREKTYGYEPMHEMPFFALLKLELFGEKDYSELGEDNFSALKDLTDDVLERLKTDAVGLDFWNKASAQNVLRTHVINKLLTPAIRQRVPGVFYKRNTIAQKILELGFQHYRNDAA